MVLDTALFNTRRYKVRIKGKVEQFWERSSALPLHLGVVAIEKGAFWSPLTKVANFTYYILTENNVQVYNECLYWSWKNSLIFLNNVSIY